LPSASRIAYFDSLGNITPEEFDRQFDTKVLGALLTGQQAEKHFPETGGSI
jgi:3-oxoacyl-[acyl-carrier protein] reductase